jgi:hypothetical protein
MSGVGNTTTLPVIAKKAKSMSLFVTRFSPEGTPHDIKKKHENNN